MNRLWSLGLLVGASAALSACDIPSATFDATTGEAGGSPTTTTDGTGASTSAGGGNTVTHPTGGSGGTGADGGGGSGGGTTTSTTTTSTTTTTTTTTTGTGAVVQCNFPNVSNCNPGEVCCFDKSEMDPVDECGAPGSCQPSTKYAELQCENNDDCPGEVCCAYYVLDANFEPQWQSMYCDTACEDDQEIKTCKSDGDCTFPIPCATLFGSAYPQYKGCF